MTHNNHEEPHLIQIVFHLGLTFYSGVMLPCYYMYGINKRKRPFVFCPPLSLASSLVQT